MVVMCRMSWILIASQYNPSTQGGDSQSLRDNEDDVGNDLVGDDATLTAVHMVLGLSDQRMEQAAVPWHRSNTVRTLRPRENCNHCVHLLLRVVGVVDRREVDSSPHAAVHWTEEDRHSADFLLPSSRLIFETLLRPL